MSTYTVKIWLILFSFCSLISATQLVSRASRPVWVKPLSADIASAPKSGEASGSYYQLLDYQYNLVKEESYLHFAYKVLTPEGVQQMSDITVGFDPAYQRLYFHQIKIHRNGKVIDKLSTEGRVRLVQREESMDRYLYDGSLTAIIHLKDVRVGDVIEYEYTRKGFNPVYDGHFAVTLYFENSFPFERLYTRIISPVSKQLIMKNMLCELKPEIQKTAKTVEYSWDIPKTAALIAENNTPDWYNPYKRVMVTDFASWQDVAVWANPYFTVSKGDLQKLKKLIGNRFKNTTKENLAIEVIRFVQDEIRYLGFESGLNSHKPHSPEKVFNQRFGDCKDKSLLLSSILKLYGIDAWPMLVNTELQNEIDNELPSHTVFDHCVVQIHLDGKEISVDPTCSNQGGDLDSYTFPFNGKGLIIRPETRALTEIKNANCAEVDEQDVFKVDSIGGGAYLTVTTVYRGKDADRRRSEFSNQSLEEVQKEYTDYYSDLYSDIKTIAPIKITDNRTANFFTVEEYYRIDKFWKPSTDDTAKIYCEVYSLSLENMFSVSKASSRKAPYSLGDPNSFHQTFTLNLPEDWNITPEDTVISSPYYTYKYSIFAIKKGVELTYDYSRNSDFVPADFTEQFVKDHQAMKSNISYYLTYDKMLGGGFRLSRLAVITAIVSLLLAIGLGLLLYYLYDPKPVNLSGKQEQIGGWLVLPAIGLILTPLVLLTDLFKSPTYFDFKTWAGLWKAESWALLSITFVEFVYNIFYLVFSVVVTILFFRRRTSVPRIVPIYLSVILVMTVADTVAVNLISHESITADSFKEIYRAIAAVLIWIPYFRISQRVKRTFLCMLHKEKESQPVVFEVDESIPLEK